MPHFNKYLAFARASLRIIFVYRAAFVLNMIGMVFYVFAMFYLWQTIFLGQPGGMSGFTWPEMKAYLLLAFLMNSMLTWYDEWIMGQDVREGRVAIDLARPIDFQAKRFADAIGPIPFEITAALTVGIAVAFLFGGIALPADPLRLVLFVISAALATMVKFGVIYCVSMTAFYTTGLMGVSFGRVAITNLFSGALIPLVFFPDWLRAIAAVLPFQAMISTPALTYLGGEHMNLPTTLLMIGIQAVWAVGLILLGRVVWRSASKAVTINGG
jgi:ABC-2 type transport system permease protein